MKKDEFEELINNLKKEYIIFTLTKDYGENGKKGDEILIGHNWVGLNLFGGVHWKYPASILKYIKKVYLKERFMAKDMIDEYRSIVEDIK